MTVWAKEFAWQRGYIATPEEGLGIARFPARIMVESSEA